MKIRLLAFAATLFLVWGAVAAVGASDQTGGTDTAGQASSVAAAVEKPSVLLPEMSYEFDPVVDGTEITHDFRVKNTGSGPLAIEQVKTG